jgi:hypothetical protein
MDVIVSDLKIKRDIRGAINGEFNRKGDLYDKKRIRIRRSYAPGESRDKLFI